MSLKAKFLLTLVVGAFSFLASMPALAAADFKSFSVEDLKKIKAESWDFDGKNIVIRGNVCIPGERTEIYADSAIINIENKDVEAFGNIRFYHWETVVQPVSPNELAEVEARNNQAVEIIGVSGDIWESPSVTVKARVLSDDIQADRLVGNLDSGFFSFDNLRMTFMSVYCKAVHGERKPDGVILVRDAEFSACSYLGNDNSHYSISANEATLTPYKTEIFGSGELFAPPGDYSILLTNGFARIYGVPVMWLPVFYKPKDEQLGLFGMQFGKDGDLGFYINTFNHFKLSDYPGVRLKVMGDFYSRRGFGYGTEVDAYTDRSKTNFFAYAIYDKSRFKTDDYDDYRIDVPYYRYNFHLANVTHITPRLDFRMNFDFNSDPYVLKDFFEERFNSDPRPATFATLEQQFDHLSAYLYVRPKLNSFYTVTEHLPSFGLEVPRQEIFDTNLYYQGDLKTGYLKMDWVEFDEELKRGDRLKNYKTWRLDTTHFLYYPLRLDWLTIVPRAGFKLTAYSQSSKTPVTQEDHIEQYYAANLENKKTPYFFNTYDTKGGSKVRVAGELGVEASTKIHRTWSDVKNTMMRIDGLRHVMRPYVNYTFIPRPSEKRKYLYYFDDIDRITEQHFVRIGLENRLQTRDGKKLRDFFFMENYWDVYMEEEGRFNRIGNFCTNLQVSLLKNLTIGTSFSVDVGGNNDEAPEVLRNGHKAGRPNINWKWLNSWNVNITYEPVEDVELTFIYSLDRPYSSRSTYSMGSSLTQYEAGRLFDKYYDEYSQEFTVGLSMPITPDRRTWMRYKFIYDVYKGYIDTQSLQIMRQFHCFALVLACSLEYDKDAWRNYEVDYSVSVVLNGLNQPLSSQNKMLALVNSDDDDDD